MTSKLPSLAVALWATKSLFTHSIVSPTWTLISAGVKMSLFTSTRTVSASAVAAPAIMLTRSSSRPRIVNLLDLHDQVLGMLLMTLEQLEANAEQILEFGIAGGGDQRRFQRVIDRLVIG